VLRSIPVTDSYRRQGYHSAKLRQGVSSMVGVVITELAVAESRDAVAAPSVASIYSTRRA
jgi:hypothetical protein